MTSDLDIYRTANVLVNRYGDEADLVASELKEDHSAFSLSERSIFSMSGSI